MLKKTLSWKEEFCLYLTMFVAGPFILHLSWLMIIYGYLYYSDYKYDKVRFLNGLKQWPIILGWIGGLVFTTYWLFYAYQSVFPLNKETNAQLNEIRSQNELPELDKSWNFDETGSSQFWLRYVEQKSEKLEVEKVVEYGHWGVNKEYNYYLLTDSKRLLVQEFDYSEMVMHYYELISVKIRMNWRESERRPCSEEEFDQLITAAREK